MSMDRRRFLTAVAVSNAVPVFAGQDRRTISVVSSMPRVGSAKGQTDHIVNAIRLAVTEWEKLLPFKVEYLDWDDATAAAGHWVPELEANNAQKAAATPEIVACIGPYNSGAAKVSMPILNEAGIVQVSPACTYPGLTRKAGLPPKSDEPEIYRPSKRLTFCRVCPHDESQGPLTARFASSSLKSKSVFILDDKEQYGACSVANPSRPLPGTIAT
jgi:branched-chain amino acid transport system substrate-binding protein